MMCFALASQVREWRQRAAAAAAAHCLPAPAVGAIGLSTRPPGNSLDDEGRMVEVPLARKEHLAHTCSLPL